MRRLPLLATVLLLGGCAQTVATLSIHDTRLPPKARRWVADAEDAVAIARAWRDEAQSDLDSARTWRDHLMATTKWPSGAKAADAAAKLKTATEDRVRYRELELDAARANLDLARAKRVQANAQTAMRYDLAVYDLKPIHKSTDSARARLKKAQESAETARIALEKATDAWWQAYKAYVSSGGNNEVLWVGK